MTDMNLPGRKLGLQFLKTEYRMLISRPLIIDQCPTLSCLALPGFTITGPTSLLEQQDQLPGSHMKALAFASISDGATRCDLCCFHLRVMSLIELVTTKSCCSPSWRFSLFGIPPSWVR